MIDAQVAYAPRTAPLTPPAKFTDISNHNKADFTSHGYSAAHQRTLVSNHINGGFYVTTAFGYEAGPGCSLDPALCGRKLSETSNSFHQKPACAEREKEEQEQWP